MLNLPRGQDSHSLEVFMNWPFKHGVQDFELAPLLDPSGHGSGTDVGLGQKLFGGHSAQADHPTALAY